jgi:DNA polymerase-4/protein ImuB
MVMVVNRGRGEGRVEESPIDAMEVDVARTIAAVAADASGLAVRVGVADGKFAAYVAAIRMKSEECRIQNRGAEFLADLSIEDLPVSAEMRRRLRRFGLRTLGDLARLPKGPVAAQFGVEGARVWELAHGIDRSPIAPYRPPRKVTERLAFPSPVDTSEALVAAVRTLLLRAQHRPEARGRAARSLRLVVHLENGHAWERSITFREPVGSAERMLLALKPKIEAGGGEAPFTEVELTLLGLCGESALQGNLFTSERSRQLDRVAEAARQLKARYGRPILAKVVEVEPWSRIPERRFALIDYDP